MKPVRIAIAVLSFFVTDAQAQILINEFSASNLHFYEDGFGEYSDFIELYNNSPVTVDLSGYYLSDDINDPDKWTIPAGVTIPAYGYQLFFPSAKPSTQFDGQAYHCTFQLTQTYQEYVVLADPLGVVIDSFWMVEPTIVNQSRGRISDGAPEWGIMANPTPGSANANVYSGYTQKPVINLQAGFYNGTQSISITTDNPEDVIRYTTNGAKPVWTSPIYSGPININTTTTIRARAFPANGGGSSPNTAYCDQSQGSAGFPDDPICQTAICGDDPFCCNNQWDNICAGDAADNNACSGCVTAANAMYCDQDQNQSGFAGNPGCQSAVCSVDPFCCNSEWDSICGDLASETSACAECLSTYIPPPPDGSDNRYPGFTETNTYFINEDFTFCTVALSGQLGQWGAGGGGGWTIVNGNLHDHYEVCFEYFDKNGVFQTEQEGTLRRHGNDSWNFDQRGMRFHSRDQQGFSNSIYYPLFESKDRPNYDVLIMKAAGSDNYPGNGWLPSAHLRDSFGQTASQKAELELDERTSEHQITYMNGNYWGIYEMRERVDKDFTEYYYNQEEQNVDLLKYWGGLEVEYGSSADWYALHNFVTNNDMSNQLNYDYVATQLNPESFIDNFIINTFFVNTDWLNWNVMWWRGTQGSGVRWRYALWDIDNIFNLGQNYTGWSGTGPYVNTVCEAQNMFQNSPASNGHTAMYAALLDNEQFFTQYLNRYADLLNTGLHCDTLVALLDEFEQRLLPEMPQHISRWGGNINTWQNRIQYIREFICLRWDVVMNQIVDCFEDDYDISGPYEITVVIIGPGNVELNSVTIQVGPWTGSYFGGLNLDLTALPLDNAEFIEWQLNNNYVGQNLLDYSLPVTLNQNDTIFAYFEYIDPLPVEWLDFSGVVHDQLGKLQWSTASELNSSHFEVQRSADALNFEKIGTVAASGNSTKINEYFFTDRGYPEGIQYYRLKQLDFNGAYDYSKTIALDFGSPETALVVAPVPNDGNFYIVNQSSGAISAELISPLGQHVRFIKLEPGTTTFVNITDHSSGIYLLRYQSGNRIGYKKIAVQ